MNPITNQRRALSLGSTIPSLVVALAIVAGASGCAHAPTHAAVSVPEGRARIVVALPQGSGLSHAVVLDEQRRVGTVAAGEWMSVDVKPGEHTLFAYATDETACLTADAKVTPCPSVGTLHARLVAGRIYYATIERLSSSRSPDVVRVELVRSDAAAIDATRERKATLSPLDGLDQSAIRAGRDRQRFDGDWDPRTSSLDLHHGDAAPRDATWTSSTFPF